MSKLRIVRVIAYEGTEEQLRGQMALSLLDGDHRPGGILIEVRTTVRPAGFSPGLGRGPWHDGTEVSRG